MRELKFALICKEVILNRFECDNYEEANKLARASHDDEAFAVDSTNYKTAIGDSYINGKFYHMSEEGTLEEAEYIPTEKEMIDDLQYKLLQSQLVLTDTYEEKLELENKLNVMQQTIDIIYEKIGG